MSASDSSVPGVSLPRQERSRASFARMVDAAWGLLERGGVEAVTVQEVVEQAGVGVGSFYARFEGRDALLAYLHERLWAHAGGWWKRFLDPSRWEGVGTGLVVSEVTRVLVRAHFAREARLRAFWGRAVIRPADGVMERTAEWDGGFVEGMATLLESRADGLSHPRPERATRLGAFNLLATLRGHLFFPDSVSLRGGLTVRELILELAGAYLSYLGAEAGPNTYTELLRASARLPPSPGSGRR